MADLQSEIAARKQRIAELCRQRDAAPAPAPKPAVPLTMSVPRGPHIDIPEPFLYERATQTHEGEAPEGETPEGETPGGETPEKATQEHERKPHEGKSQQNQQDRSEKPTEASDSGSETPSGFSVQAPDHVSPQLLTFLDDGWRAVARGAVRDFRQTPRRPKAAAADAAELVLAGEVSGAHLLAFSPFHPLVAALDAPRRRVLISGLPAGAGVEFTLRSPTALTANIVFSPLVAQQVFGAGQNGQLFVWDLKSMVRKGGRYDVLPQMRSPIESSAVVALRSLGPASLVSVNADGLVKVWATDRLSRALHMLVLEDTFRTWMASVRLAVLVPTCMDVFCADYGLVLGFGWKIAVVGTLSGHLLRLPNTPTGDAYNPVDRPWRHGASVSCLALGAADEGGAVRLVSGGLDWQICVWRVPLDERQPPALERSFRVDYAVSAVALHHSGLLAAGGERTVQVYRLDRARPLLSVPVAHAVESIAFRGDTLAVATSEGVLLYDFEYLQ